MQNKIQIKLRILDQQLKRNLKKPVVIRKTILTTYQSMNKHKHKTFCDLTVCVLIEQRNFS